jgi:hypothetical protein
MLLPPAKHKQQNVENMLLMALLLYKEYMGVECVSRGQAKGTSTWGLN